MTVKIPVSLKNPHIFFCSSDAKFSQQSTQGSGLLMPPTGDLSTSDEAVFNSLDRNEMIKTVLHLCIHICLCTGPVNLIPIYVYFILSHKFKVRCCPIIKSLMICSWDNITKWVLVKLGPVGVFQRVVPIHGKEQLIFELGFILVISWPGLAWKLAALA